MATRSSSKDGSGPRAADPAKGKRQFASGALELRCVDAVLRPVDLAKLLKREGLSLRQAHAALSALVAGQPVAITVGRPQPTIVADFAALGIAARPLP